MGKRKKQQSKRGRTLRKYAKSFEYYKDLNWRCKDKECVFGIEPSLAEQMKNMAVGETLYTTGYYKYQIIRKKL